MIVGVGVNTPACFLQTSLLRRSVFQSHVGKRYPNLALGPMKNPPCLCLFMVRLGVSERCALAVIVELISTNRTKHRYWKHCTSFEVDLLFWDSGISFSRYIVRLELHRSSHSSAKLTTFTYRWYPYANIKFSNLLSLL